MSEQERAGLAFDLVTSLPAGKFVLKRLGGNDAGLLFDLLDKLSAEITS